MENSKVMNSFLKFLDQFFRDETFRKFINFINCPLTEKVWDNPVYGTFNLYLPYAFFSACVLFI
jgi:hypothetical protein